MFLHLRMNLAYKKILGKFTKKVLGFGKTPLPHVGKNSQIISFFSLRAYLNRVTWKYASSFDDSGCCGDDKMTTGCPQKKLPWECFWSHGEPAQSPASGRHPAQPDLDEPVSGNYYFWSFLTKIKQDQVLPSHAHKEIWPNSNQFWLGFFY